MEVRCSKLFLSGSDSFCKISGTAILLDLELLGHSLNPTLLVLALVRTAYRSTAVARYSIAVRLWLRSGV